MKAVASADPVRTRKRYIHARRWSWLVFLILLLVPVAGFAADPPPGIQLLNVQPGANGSQTWSLSIQMLALMTALTALPAILLMMTSFTRIIIVLGFLRQALGTNSTPPNQVILGLSLFLTLFVMSPVINKAYDAGIKPYMDGQMSVQEAMPSPPRRSAISCSSRPATRTCNSSPSWPVRNRMPTRTPCLTAWRCRPSSPAS